jgi:hypothetical protein
MFPISTRLILIVARDILPATVNCNDDDNAEIACEILVPTLVSDAEAETTAAEFANFIKAAVMSADDDNTAADSAILVTV